MKITALQEYGVRILLQLAERQSDRPVRTRMIASMEALSVDYVEKILTRLRKEGLVKSVRGLNGGYILSHKPEKIYLSQAFRALTEKPIQLNHIKRDLCGQFPGNQNACVHLRGCAVRQMWSMVIIQIFNHLNKITLSDLLGTETVVQQRLLNTLSKNQTPAFKINEEPIMAGEVES
ncbi:MAG: Rrf2 family transcriptional regulator [Elusimicrobia bacterium]|nr:Rrf2 family transcriptional regulator [Elusimicrobiota bacterium]